MIDPLYECPNRVDREWLCEHKRVTAQVKSGQVRVGPDAAREIARRIEAQGGFWGPRTMAVA